MPRIRLLATCQINGAVHHAGEIVEIPEGVRGPHRTVAASNHGAQIAAPRYHRDDEDSDVKYAQQDLVDHPLYEVVEDAVPVVDPTSYMPVDDPPEAPLATLEHREEDIAAASGRKRNARSLAD